MVALQHVLDPAVEPLDHAVGLGRSGRREAVFNIEGCAERVEVVLACRGAFAQAEEPVGELLAIVRQDGADPYWAGALQISQKAPGVGGCFAVVNADKNPTGGAINRHEQVAARRLIGHLRQVFHVDVDVSGLVSLEAAALWAGLLCLEIAQVAYTMPTQTAVQT